MKKTITILASILISGLGFYGCKKGANDPTLSFHTRKGRITGEWKISSGTHTQSSGSSVSTETWTENSVTTTSAGGSSVGTNARYILTIVKDGTWKLDQSVTYSMGTTSAIYSTAASGTWNWIGGVGDAKKKSSIVLRTLQQTDTNGGTASVSTYTGDSAPTEVFYIDELKNKELKITADGTSTSGTTTTTDKSEYTFIQ